jgi:hypothetical protein
MMTIDDDENQSAKTKRAAVHRRAVRSLPRVGQRYVVPVPYGFTLFILQRRQERNGILTFLSSVFEQDCSIL